MDDEARTLMEERADARGWLFAPTLWGLIEARAAATPEAVLAREDTGNELTFAGYRDACLRVAAGLYAEHGVRAGTSVSWELPTWNESLVLVGALCRLGARQNPLIPIYRHREVGFIVTQSEASLLVVPTVYRGSTSRPWPVSWRSTARGSRCWWSTATSPTPTPRCCPGRGRPGHGRTRTGPMALLHVGHDG